MTYNEKITLRERVFGNDDNLPDFTVKLKEAITIFTYDNGVTYHISSLHTGLTKKSNKRWYRWSKDEYYRFTVKTLKNGRNYLFLYNGRTKREMSRLPLLVEGETVLLNYVFPICEKLISKRPESIITAKDTFFYYAKPAMVGKRSVDAGLARDLKVSFRLDSVQKITKKLYGKERYRKDLVKAVAGAETYTIVKTAAELGNYSKIPTDWLIDLINNKWLATAIFETFDFLSVVPEKHWRKFFTSDSISLLEDINRMATRYLVADNDFDWTGSVDSIHDRLIAFRNQAHIARQAKKNKQFLEPFEYPEWLENTRDSLWNDHGLLLAETPKMLAEWSSYMNNCISSYDWSVREGGTYLFGYYGLGKELIANIEIRGKTLKQLLGKYNQTVDSDLYNRIVAILEQNELIDTDTTSDVWGVPAVPLAEYYPVAQRELVW